MNGCVYSREREKHSQTRDIMVMNNYDESQGIVREGTEDSESILAWLVWYSFRRGGVSYDELVEEAHNRGWRSEDLPEMRRLQTAFVKAKDTLNGLESMVGISRLEALEGWDGQVSQQIKVVVLQKNLEYQVSLRREGRVEGKLHVENHPVLRLLWSPPTDFDHVAWRTNYMERVWARYQEPEDGEETVEEVSDDALSLDRLNECIEVTAYWDETDVDPMFIATIIANVRTAFRREALLINEESLKKKVESVVTGQLRGIPYRQQKSMYAIPRQIEIDGEMESTLPIIQRLDELVEFFTNHNPTRVDWGDMTLPRGQRRVRGQPRNTAFNYLQVLRGERELRYLRESVVAEERQQRAEVYDRLLRAAESFNDQSTEDFVEHVSAIAAEYREESMGRISFLPDDDTAYDDIDDDIYQPFTEQLESRINVISENNEAVATALLEAVGMTGGRINF